jgi:hypothetical protein
MDGGRNEPEDITHETGKEKEHVRLRPVKKKTPEAAGSREHPTVLEQMQSSVCLPSDIRGTNYRVIKNSGYGCKRCGTSYDPCN